MVGRPTTCTPEVIEKAYAYVSGEWETEAGDAVPSIVGLCSYIDRSTSSVYRWRDEENNPFRDILAKIMQEQEKVTFNRSLTGEYNATIAKLLLGKHGYHDRADHTIGGGDKPLDLTWTVNVVKPGDK
jgi:hypothetical protein